LDQPFEFKPTEHGHYIAAPLTKDAEKKLSVGEAIGWLENSDLKTIIVGNPSDVADAIQYQFDASGVDGFNLNNIVSLASLEDFIDLVVPILQERGLYKTEYKKGTLREKLFNDKSSLLLV